MRVDARRVILAATAAWAVAAIVLACFWTPLGEHGHRSWFWTCACAAVLGLLGLVLIGKHRGEGRVEQSGESRS